MIPSSRPKRSDLYTLSQSKLLENHTLHSGTYLYSPYMAVPPRGGGGPSLPSSFLLADIFIPFLMFWAAIFMTTHLLINFVTKLLLVTSFSKLDPGFQLYADHTSQTVFNGCFNAKLCKLFCNVALPLPVNLHLESIKTYGFRIFSFLVSLCFI